MTKGSGTENNNGFTLTETVAVLSIAVVLAVFTSSFVHPQMKLYYDLNRISRTKTMCGEAYRGLEEKLRYGYMFFCDHRDTGVISYYVRSRQEVPDLEEGGLYYKKLPPVKDWPGISVEELDAIKMDGMELEPGSSGTENTRARVSVKVKKDKDVIYEQKAVIGSMYGYTMDREGRTRWTGEKREESVMDIPGEAA